MGSSVKLVLLAFHEADRSLYGRELARATHLEERTISQILERFREDGWVERGEPTPSPVGPARYYYELTPLGENAVDRLIERQPGFVESRGALDMGLSL